MEMTTTATKEITEARMGRVRMRGKGGGSKLSIGSRYVQCSLFAPTYPFNFIIYSAFTVGCSPLSTRFSACETMMPVLMFPLISFIVLFTILLFFFFPSIIFIEKHYVGSLLTR